MSSLSLAVPTRAASPPTPRARLGGWVVAVLVAVAVLSVWRALGPLTYPGDEWRQADTASIARNFARNGMDLFYPQIQWGGVGPGYVEMELPLLSWLTAGLYLVFGEHPSIGRLLSLLFVALAAAAFWGLARRLLPLPAARWALVAFAVSPVVMRWGTAFMPDASALAFATLTLLLFCRWLQEDRGRFLAGAAAALSVAALLKPTALHTALVLLLWLLIGHRDRLRRPSLYAAGLAGMVAPALWLAHAASLHATYGNTFGVISGGDSKWGSLALWLSPEFYLGNLRAEALFVYGAVGIPFAVLGVLWLRRHRRGTAAFLLAGLVALVVYYAAVGRYSSSDLGLQYHVFSLPYAALATGAGLAVAARWLRRRFRPATAVVLGVVTVLLLGAQSGYVLARSFEDDSGSLGACATVLARLSRPGDPVVIGTDSTSVQDGVANNYQEPIVFYRADRHGWSLPADRYDPALVASYRHQGARWFVNPDPALLPAGSPLATWLTTHATPVATDATAGCDVWNLHPSRTAPARAAVPGTIT